MSVVRQRWDLVEGRREKGRRLGGLRTEMLLGRRGMSFLEELRVLEGFLKGGEDERSTERDSIDGRGGG